jgi:site-specific DNA-cytosine methylase
VERYYLDLFAGFGGWALGAYWAGWRFDGHYFSEIEKYPVEVYSLRFPEAIALGDIRNIRGEGLPHGDWYLSGSFPCVDCSIAGKREGIRVGNESGLWFEYARLIRELRPKFALVENVGNLTGKGLDIVLSSLSEAGYSAAWIDLWASDVGAPHPRERIWFVAYPDEFGWRGGVFGAGCEGTILHQEGAQTFRGNTADAAAGTGYGSEVVARGLSVPNTDSARQQGEPVGSPWDSFKGSIKTCGFGGAWQAESRVFPLADGVPRALGKRRLSRDAIESQGWATHIREQVKGYGNAILPQIAEILWNLISDADRFCAGVK